MGDAPNVVLATARTSVSEISLADAPFMFELLRSPGWIKYIGDRKLSDVEQVAAYIEQHYIKVRQQYGLGYYLVRDLAGAGMGVAGFLKRDYLDNLDFGFAFMPAFSGQGFATEAARALVTYGASQLGFTVLDAVTMQENLPAKRLLEKLGFTLCGDIQVPDSPAGWQQYRWHKVASPVEPGDISDLQHDSGSLQ